MSKAEPTVQKFMTTQPYAVEESQTLSEARRMMGELKIRHLPVMRGEEVVGVLSDRDIRTALGLSGIQPEKTFVRDIFHDNPYVTSPETPLAHVTQEMASHHYGCAIVVQNKKLVGIFTAVDACAALTQILQQRYHG